MKIDERSAFVLGKYKEASKEYAQVQRELLGLVRKFAEL